MVTSYWEMVASFVTSGVLNEELFFQSGQELLLTWVRVKPFVQELRAVSHPNAWRNLEMAGERFIQYWESTTPERRKVCRPHEYTRRPSRRVQGRVVRQDPEFFGERDLELVDIAKRLKEALRLEEFLTVSNIDYLVETDTYRGGMIFVSERTGVFFYVDPDIGAAVRERMRLDGFKPWDV